jgi:DNA-binding NarL/FixJ family response regulator
LLLDRKSDLVVAATGPARHAEACAKALRPDVLLMDGDMRDGDGFALTRVINRRMPRTGVVSLFANPSVETIKAATSADVSGVAGKRCRLVSWPPQYGSSDRAAPTCALGS